MAMGWICNHLAKGGVVASNINIQIDSFEDQYGKKKGIRTVLWEKFSYRLKDEQIITLSDTELIPYQDGRKTLQLNSIVMFYKKVPRGTPSQPVLVVIDEAHIHFPQDAYRGIPREVLHFLTFSRHACVDVVFISQHIKNMWCQMSRLTQFRWAVRDMRKYGVPVGVFNFPWFFPHFLQIKNDYDGVTPMKRRFEWHRTYLYETYRSPELASSFESMDVASSVSIEKRKMTMKEGALIFIAGFAVCFCCLVLPGCLSGKKEAAVVPVTNSAPVEVSSVPSPSVPDLPEDDSEPVVERFAAFGSDGFHRRLCTWDGHVSRHYVEGELFEGRLILSVSESAKSVTLDNGDGTTETVRF